MRIGPARTSKSPEAAIPARSTEGSTTNATWSTFLPVGSPGNRSITVVALIRIDVNGVSPRRNSSSRAGSSPSLSRYQVTERSTSRTINTMWSRPSIIGSSSFEQSGRQDVETGHAAALDQDGVVGIEVTNAFERLVDRADAGASVGRSGHGEHGDAERLGQLAHRPVLRVASVAQ